MSNQGCPRHSDAQLCIDTIRCLAADVVQGANSGHPGAPMGMAPMAHVLFTQFLTVDPEDPKWPNRDRFVLSNGHACALQYSLLHLLGFKVSMDDLKRFRQLGSITPGHPEVGVTPGIEVTTGPLGQGLANAVGLAVAQTHMAAHFNKPGFPLFDHYTYVFVGDGCLQEGITGECSSLAGHWRLGRLIVLYDDNSITIDGRTDLSFSEDVLKRYEAYGWHVQRVYNGNENYKGIEQAVAEARHEVSRPSLIAVRTVIGWGAPLEDTSEVHGSPLGKQGVRHAKQRLQRPPDAQYEVPAEVYKRYRDTARASAQKRQQWLSLMRQYATDFPKEAAELKRRMAGQLPAQWEQSLPRDLNKKADATRGLGGKCLDALAKAMPELIGGSADLTPSNKTRWKGAVDYQHDARQGRYFRFGVREHAMAAIGNGLAAYGGLVPFTATFLNFIEYMLPAVRLAALSHLQQLFIMTHDSIGLAEDGPTHQPIEALQCCRAMPNCLTLRPCDGTETAACYAAAIRNRSGPSVLALTRQTTKPQAGSSWEGTMRGGYVLVDCDGGGRPDVILVASGSEVEVCTEAVARLAGRKVRVVSMPCTQLFDEQPVEYRRQVLTPGVLTVSVEASSVVGWERYAHFSLGLHSYGASAPLKEVMRHFGFTPDQVAARVLEFAAEAKQTATQTQTQTGLGPLATHFKSTKGNMIRSHL